MIWFSRREIYIYFQRIKFRVFCQTGNINEVFRLLNDLYNDEDYALVVQIIDDASSYKSSYGNHSSN